MENKIKILLLGATGLIGEKVLKELVKNASYEIGILVKNLESRKEKLFIEYGNSIIYFSGDILAKESLTEPIKWSDVVINCTGKVSYRKKYKKLLYDINVTGSQNIINLCSVFNKKLIHTSSAVVYGYSKVPSSVAEDNISENKIYKTNSAYYITKYESDKIALSAKIKKIILRPSSVIARKSSTVGKIKNLVMKNIYPVLKGGANFVLVDDLAKAYMTSLEKIITDDGFTTAVYNLGGSNLPFADISDYFVKLYQIKKINIPSFFLKGIGIFNDYIIEPIFNTSILTSEQVKITNNFSYIDSTKAVNELKYQITSFEESIKEIL